MTTYGRSSGFCTDRIEKYRGTIFTRVRASCRSVPAGRNFSCKFRQDRDIGRSQDIDRLMDEPSPAAIAQAAVNAGTRSVAFADNDPVIFTAYAMDVADACHERGIKIVAVIAGYIRDAPRRAFFATMDAANVNLKDFNDDFHIRLYGVRLQPESDTPTYLKPETAVWLEITTLLIPGQNDADDC